jgi:response regulator RpfG family c-di-GMP phosphodiesterase
MVRTPTILLVEDEERWQTRITEVLATFEVIVCDSRRRALSLLQSGLSVDAIIVDLKLGLDPDAGKELLADLMTVRPHTPKAILTAHKQKGSMREAMDEYGVDDIIYKGLIGSELLRAVNRIIRRNEPDAGNAGAEDNEVEDRAAHALQLLAERVSQLQSARMRADVQGLVGAVQEVNRQIDNLKQRAVEVDRLRQEAREQLMAETKGEERLRVVLRFVSAIEKVLGTIPT